MKKLSRLSETTVAIAAITSFLLGGVGLLAWHLQITTIIQVIPNTLPMRYNAALAFSLSGLGMLCL